MPINKEAKQLKERLQATGAVYEKVSVGHRYMQFEPGSFFASRAPLGGSGQGGGGAVSGGSARDGGRVMVDTSASHKVGHNAARGTGLACHAVLAALQMEAVAKRSGGSGRAGGGMGAESGGTGGASTLESGGDALLVLTSPLPSELLHRMWPAVAGFSITHKTWGQVS